ncbi:bifunctional glycosyltransferase family 2 protein/CDP-glycerol:glycerophosphate glycerophosphotransferase [Bacillus shivajii]|uniref:bifunctional glycosyltransferase/CDP-glycerol:glycerophosphate glycerophosphotransferase n=1 Tax=Bacillus shivajii TaxID=1983719 RepID=UPI001CFBA010|nr:bifunctional glycosyltransferase family 2 protein/CDP-glycerol:glycerophosphate glycerophosphotransferase [Bacillus shivajii]UCZ52720.1 bifunctional glycosyltransferase family 2 protein/CDP-glycerol:glycerophosphate glycerophosphotransferase [Bacillus shivajii]
MSKVSVIVPVYNDEENIGRCLHSISEQTHSDIEVIIIDDGSNDGTHKVIEKYLKDDNRFYYINNDNNQGVASARNTGIKKATGDFLYFIDSDDFIAPYSIEVLVNHIKDHLMIVGPIHKYNSAVEFTQPDINAVKVKKIKAKSKKFASRTRSVANILFNAEFIREQDVFFEENVKHYSDLSFNISLFQQLSELPQVNTPTYMRGPYDDPINKPRLHQLTDDQKIYDFLYVYNQLAENFVGNSAIKKDMDNRLLDLYFNTVVNRVLDDEDVLGEWIASLTKAVQHVNKKEIARRGSIGSKEILAIKSGNLKLTLKRMKMRTFVSRVKKVFKSKQNLYKELYQSLFQKLPLKKNRVVFESFGGKSYSCNPKYIYEELLKENDNKYKFIWIYEGEKEVIPGNPIVIKRFSLKYYYYLATSKYWVFNARTPNFLTKREGIVYLQTWHGTPLKKLGVDIKEVQMPGTTTEKYKWNFYNESRKWDYLISPNSYSTTIFKRAFHFDKHMLEFGYPRNDALYLENDQLEKKKKEVIAKSNLPTNKKVILYAPTWRDDEFFGKGKYKFDIKLNLEEMKKQLGNEYVVVLRMHYLISNNLNIDGLEGFAYNLSDYEDIAELYLISDILITDYSSVFFDYANLKRPMIFYAYDIDKYRENLRGFYMDYENELPGPIIKSTDEVIRVVKDIGHIQEDYKEKMHSFYNKFCNFDDGKAARNVINAVVKK